MLSSECIYQTIVSKGNKPCFTRPLPTMVQGDVDMPWLYYEAVGKGKLWKPGPIELIEQWFCITCRCPFALLYCIVISCHQCLTHPKSQRSTWLVWLRKVPGSTGTQSSDVINIMSIHLWFPAKMTTHSFTAWLGNSFLHEACMWLKFTPLHL